MATTIRYAIVVAACVFGAFTAFGCGIAALLELQGFGGPRDSGARPLYVSAMIAGMAAGAILPIVLWKVLLPDNAPSVLVGVGLFVVALIVLWMIAGLG